MDGAPGAAEWDLVFLLKRQSVQSKDSSPLLLGGGCYFGHVYQYELLADLHLRTATIPAKSMASCANQPQRRLGTRVRAQIPVRITSLDPSIDFSESCYTLLVNPKGCGIRCSRPLTAGLRLRVDELPGRGTAIATVACARPLEEGSRYWIVGISLESPGNLWLIAPTPDDWGYYSLPPKFVPASVTELPKNPFAAWLTARRIGKA